MMQQYFLCWSHREVVFGPVMDPAGAYRMGVIEAADESVARAIAAGDPVIKAGCGFKYEIHSMRAVTRETVN